VPISLVAPGTVAHTAKPFMCTGGIAYGLSRSRKIANARFPKLEKLIHNWREILT
jgi:hypothetical protein